MTAIPPALDLPVLGETPGTSVGLNLYDLYLDSIGSVMTGAGAISFNLVLQAGPVTYGAFQSSATDPTALPGDEYVVGQTSGVAADLTAFNGGTLLINSITSNNGFIFNEPLLERRLYRPSPSQWILQSFVDDTSTWAALQRVSALNPTPNNNISSWSFVTNDDGTANSQAVWSIVTVNTTAAHGLNPGQWVNISGPVVFWNAAERRVPDRFDPNRNISDICDYTAMFWHIHCFGDEQLLTRFVYASALQPVSSDHGLRGWSRFNGCAYYPEQLILSPDLVDRHVHDVFGSDYSSVGNVADIPGQPDYVLVLRSWLRTCTGYFWNDFDYVGTCHIRWSCCSI